MISKIACTLFFLFSFVFTNLCCDTVDTFYGPLEVDEPVLLELIRSPAFQRLKFIHQYGAAYYTKTHPEEYSRFDHSLGVFAILRAKGAALDEQIAGLLHDISHTVFSHVGDWVFAKELQEDDYQNHIHDHYLRASGIEEILNRHGFQIEEISPKRVDFVMLEQPLPDLCADRIDYNIQGAYYQQFLSLEEAKRLFHEIVFEKGRWVISDRELALKLANFSLFMTTECWGSAANWITSRWLADAIIQGCKTGALSWHEFHFGVDQEIWDKLLASQDPLIQEQMEKLAHPSRHFRLVSPQEATLLIPFKCRGIDPWVREQDVALRLSTMMPEFKRSFENTKRQSLEGWPVSF